MTPIPSKAPFSSPTTRAAIPRPTPPPSSPRPSVLKPKSGEHYATTFLRLEMRSSPSGKECPLALPLLYIYLREFASSLRMRLCEKIATTGTRRHNAHTVVAKNIYKPVPFPEGRAEGRKEGGAVICIARERSTR